MPAVRTTRRWLGRLLWIAVPLAVLAGAAAFLLWPRHETLYTDGNRSWASPADLGLRTVLWDAGDPLAALNAPTDSYDPCLSPDGQSLYFTRGRAGGTADLYVASRAPAGWGEPRPVRELNTAADEIGPALAPDGRRLYFYSNRPGGLGGHDLYVATLNAGRWGEPANLGPRVNSPFNEYDPCPAPDGATLLFSSNRPAADRPASDPALWRATLREEPYQHDYDLYAVDLPGTGPGARADARAAPRRLDALNSPWNDGQPAFSPDGRWLYFASDRDGHVGPTRNYDLYRSRITTLPLAGLMPPENLGSSINTPANELDPTVSLEGFALYFSSNRPRTGPDLGGPAGAYGIYYARSHEVYQVLVARRLDLGYILGRLSWPMVALILVLAGLGLALLALTKLRRRPGLMASSLILSLILHLLALNLFTVWKLSVRVSEIAKDEQRFAVSVSLPGLAESELASDLRSALAELARADTARFNLQKAESLAQNRPAPTPVAGPPVPPAVPEPPPREVRVAEVARPRAIEEKLRQPAPVELAPEKPIPLPEPKAEVPPKEARPAVELAELAPRRFEPAPHEPALTTPEAAVMPEPLLDPPDLMPAAPAARIASAAAAPKPSELLTAARGPRPADLAIEAPSPRMNEKLPLVDVGPAEKMPGRPASTGASPNGTKGPEPLVPQESLATARPPAATPAPPGPVTEPIGPAVALGPAVDRGASLLGSTAAPAAPARAPRIGETIRLPSTDKPPALPPGGAGEADLTKAPEPIPAKEIYRLRTQPGRERLIEKLGGTPETEEAVRRALTWLARHQSPDGRWDMNHFMRNYEQDGQRADGSGGRENQDLDLTGLVVLAFLAGGHTHAPPLGADRVSLHAQTVRKALDFIIAGQKADGDLRRGGQMYGQFMATMALAESYILTGDKRLAEPVRRSVRFILDAQDPRFGWRYEPRTDNDTSVIGWGVMALKSAQIAGFEVPPRAYRGAANWLDTVRKGRHGGLYQYQPSRAPNPAMTAQGLFTQQLIEFQPDSPRTLESIEYLMKHRPAAKPRKSEERDLYYWYIATLALHQIGGPRWEEWNRDLRKALVESQRTDGPFLGSWDPVAHYDQAGGRVYTTAIAALTLEVYYRYLPFHDLQLGDLSPADKPGAK